MTMIKTQFGSSMIEVLVAIVIFAFGILGLAGLQARTLSYSQGALFRSQATALTDDIVDRIRADRVNAIAGNYTSALAASGPSGTQFYQTELSDWRSQVSTLLPSGQGGVSVDATSKVITITIQWDDSRGRESAVQFVTKSQL